jgi:hypothetical protein
LRGICDAMRERGPTIDAAIDAAHWILEEES